MPGFVNSAIIEWNDNEGVVIALTLSKWRFPDCQGFLPFQRKRVEYLLGRNTYFQRKIGCCHTWWGFTRNFGAFGSWKGLR